MSKGGWNRNVYFLSQTLLACPTLSHPNILLVPRLVYWERVTLQVGEFERSSDGVAHTGFEVGKTMEAKNSAAAGSCRMSSARVWPTRSCSIHCGWRCCVPTQNLMRPFPRQHLLRWRIFNYGLSTVRIVVECDLGILSVRQMVLYTGFTLKPQHEVIFCLSAFYKTLTNMFPLPALQNMAVWSLVLIFKQSSYPSLNSFPL